MVRAVYINNISILEFFQFDFIGKNDNERDTYAGTGFMYEYQLKMNPKDSRRVLANKLLFIKRYSQFIGHFSESVEDVLNDPELLDRILSFRSGKAVLKSSLGQCGNGIEILSLIDFDRMTLRKVLEETSNDMIEEFIIQHDDLTDLAPAGLNTLRIITQVTDTGEIDIVDARLRLTIDSHVDNLAAGNIALSIDPDSGQVDSDGIYSDITKSVEQLHPISNRSLRGFQIPFWNEVIDFVIKVAKNDVRNRSVGWDIAVTNQGPDLVEGNHDWCKLLWQLPVRKGLKHKLTKYLEGQ